MKHTLTQKLFLKNFMLGAFAARKTTTEREVAVGVAVVARVNALLRYRACAVALSRQNCRAIMHTISSLFLSFFLL